MAYKYILYILYIAFAQVAFRCDDIQDDYLYEAQRAIINVFVNKQEKCTVNIIGGIYFGGSGIGSMKEYVQEGINSGFI